jgi:hypothetical protein
MANPEDPKDPVEPKDLEKTGNPTESAEQAADQRVPVHYDADPSQAGEHAVVLGFDDDLDDYEDEADDPTTTTGGGFTAHFLHTLDETSETGEHDRHHCRDFPGIEQRLKGSPERYLPAPVEAVEAQLMAKEGFESAEEFREKLIIKRFPHPRQQKYLKRIPQLEFENEIYPLLLLFELNKNKIPGLGYKLMRALHTVIRGAPFIGTTPTQGTVALRFDVEGSSTLRERLGKEDAIKQINQDMFEAIQLTLPAYNDLGIYLMETGGDEAVLTVLEPNKKTIDHFLHDLRKHLVEINPEIGFHVGKGKGITLITTTSEGHFFVNGPAYKEAKYDQDREKQDKRSGKFKTPKINDRYFRRADTATRVSGLTFGGLSTKDPDFTKNLRQVMAHILSTTPPGFLDQSEQNFTDSNILMIKTTPVEWDGMVLNYEQGLESLSRFIGEAASKPAHNVRFTYTTPDVWLGFRGALGSPTLRQTIASLQFATQVRSHENVEIIAITQGPVYFGSMSSTSTGASTKIEQAARELSLIRDDGSLVIADSRVNPKLKHGIGPQDVQKFMEWQQTNRGETPILIEAHMISEIEAMGYDVLNPSPPIRAFLRGVNDGMPVEFVACCGIEEQQIETTLHGRTAEYNQCLSIMADSLADRDPYSIQVCGDHGTGKTLLIDTYLKDLRQNGFVTTGRDRQHRHQPFGHIRDILRSYFGLENSDENITDSNAFNEWMNGHGTPTAELMDFKDAIHNLETLDRGNAQHPSPETLAEFLYSLSRSMPMAIVAEEWERIDLPSRHVLEHFMKLSKEGNANPVILVQSHLEAPVEGQNAILLNGLPENGVFEIIRDTLHIGHGVREDQLTGQIAAYIRSQKGLQKALRNPFILKQICARILKGDGQGNQFINHDTKEFTYPSGDIFRKVSSLQHFVFEKSETLSAVSKQVLVVACLLGEGTPASILERTCFRLGLVNIDTAIAAINHSELAEIDMDSDEATLRFPRAFVPTQIEELHRWKRGLSKTDIHAAIAATLEDQGEKYNVKRSYHLCEGGNVPAAIDLIQGNKQSRYLDMQRTEHAFQALADQIETMDASVIPSEKLVSLYLDLASIRSELRHEAEDLLPLIKRAREHQDRLEQTDPTNPTHPYTQAQIHNTLCKIYYMTRKHDAFQDAATNAPNDELDPASPEMIDRAFYEAAVIYRKAGNLVKTRETKAEGIEQYKAAIPAFEAVEARAQTHSGDNPELIPLMLEANRVRSQIMAYLCMRGKWALDETLSATQATIDLYQEHPEHQVPTRICALYRLRARCFVQLANDFESATECYEGAAAVASQFRNRAEEIENLTRHGENQWYESYVSLKRHFDEAGESFPEWKGQISSRTPVPEAERKRVQDIIGESIVNLRLVLSKPDLLTSAPKAPLVHAIIAEQLELQAELTEDLRTKRYLVTQAIGHIDASLSNLKIVKQAGKEVELTEDDAQGIRKRLAIKKADLQLEIGDTDPTQTIDAITVVTDLRKL